MMNQGMPAALLFMAVFLNAARTPAAEAAGVRLMRPDSLAGWEYGLQSPEGWTIAQGRLSGTKDATPLLSGFTFGECRIELRWSVADSGTLKVVLPEAPRGKGLELRLREGDAGGQLLDDGKELAPGTRIASFVDKMHTMSLLRTGDTLTVAVDGKQLYQVRVAAQRRFGLGLAVLDGRAAVSDIFATEPSGFPLVKNRKLDGWWSDGKKDAWRVVGDELVLKPAGGNGSYLMTEKEYGNFTLSLEYRMVNGTNSGVGIRTPRGGWPSGDGMEIQIFESKPDMPLDEHAPMAIYGNVPPLARADKQRQWNRIVVKADGWMISAWVNGELVQQYNTLNHPELKHRHLRGWIGLQDHSAEIHFRNLCSLESPDGAGLDVWSLPKPPTAETTMVDRLMNPESVGRVDGITSGVVATKVENAGPAGRTLANLSGPGAVVRVARSNDQGVLAFYFDGEAKPRIECKPADLWQHVPPLNEDPSPVLTYLGYRKSLKITLREAKAAEYRVDYVTFPTKLPVTTFNGRLTSIPRGWLSAPLYRRHMFDWGVHRENEPTPRIRPEVKTIAPGKNETLARCNGAGIVRWVKLRADAAVFRNNDLWLEATIDGETSPAVSAPARFWFPGLIEGSNFYNYVLVSREGFASMLAMPFGDGITISAKNHGNRPIANVGIELSVEPATDKTRDEILRRPRLRGNFQPACESTDEFFHQEGKGRWVALVLAAAQGKTPGVGGLAIDGAPADGWTVPGLDLFLGQSGGDFRQCLSGNHHGVAWRYLLLAPVDFQKSLVMQSTTKKLPDRFALFYMENALFYMEKR
jgi:hypothetical protein